MKSWWNMRETHINMLRIEYRFVALDEFVLCIVYNSVEFGSHTKGIQPFYKFVYFLHLLVLINKITLE